MFETMISTWVYESNGILWQADSTLVSYIIIRVECLLDILSLSRKVIRGYVLVLRMDVKKMEGRGWGLKLHNTCSQKRSSHRYWDGILMYYVCPWPMVWISTGLPKYPLIYVYGRIKIYKDIYGIIHLCLNSLHTVDTCKANYLREYIYREIYVCMYRHPV